MKSIKRIFILIFINIVVFEGLLHIVPPFDRYVTYEDAEIRGARGAANRRPALVRMRLPRTPTQAPTASTLESTELTAILVR